MKKSIAIAIALLGIHANAQVVLQNFSNVVDGTSNFFTGTWEATGNTTGTTSPNPGFSQGSGVFNFTASTGTIPTNDGLSYVEFFNPTAVNIGTNTYISVTAQALSGNASGGFTVFLFDTGGGSASATFNAFDFVTGSYSTVSQPYTTSGAFNPSAIDSLRISGNQPSGTAAFRFSFDNISASAIPEPSTYAAIVGLTAFGAFLWRRKTSAGTNRQP